MIQSIYSQLCEAPSDINEHLPTLEKYASECSHVTECGVRSAVSSYAFANALLKKPGSQIIQVDLTHSPGITQFQKICRSEGLDAMFYNMSDLECPMEETDLLFIDTWHIYGHLKRELARWHSHVRKYIIMHDTVVDGVHGETVRCGWDANEQSRASGIPVDEIRKGLGFAINEFIRDHPEWVVHAHFPNNNGLTVLTRCRST